MKSVLARYAAKLLAITITKILHGYTRAEAEYDKLLRSNISDTDKIFLKAYRRYLRETISLIEFVFLEYNPRTRTFKCNVCGKTGFTPRGIYLHVIRKHIRELEAIISDVEDSIRRDERIWIFI